MAGSAEGGRARRRRGVAAGMGRLVFGAALLAGSACGDPLDPGAFSDTYVLTSVAGEPLPTVLTENEIWRFRVVSDVLVLNGDGTGHRATAGEGQRLDLDQPAESVEWRVDLTYRVDDARIVIDYVCDDVASCIAPPHLIARPTPTGLRAESRIGERQPLVYERALRVLAAR